jgi:hypothetical protein
MSIIRDLVYGWQMATPEVRFFMTLVIVVPNLLLWTV